VIRAARSIAKAYLAVVALYYAGVVAATAVMRLRRSTSGPDELPAIRNLRRVGDDLWAGAQPDHQGYRQLARLGVQRVIDLRAGGPIDPCEDDPQFLAGLGIDHVPLPLHDGHAPHPRLVMRFLHDSDEQAAFVHCAAGVGRSGAMQAAYLWRRGEHFGLADYLAIGPPSFEQLWFVGRGKIDHVPIPVRLISRAVDAPRLAWGHLRRLLQR